ncbi:MAG: alpha-galactosidase [Pseudomonadota bacterium]
MITEDGTITLTAGNTSLVIDCEIGRRPSILHWGARLSQSDSDSLRRMTKRQHAPGGADAEVASSLLNETGSGLAGLSGFSAHRNGTSWASLFQVSSVEQPSPSEVHIICDDQATEVRATMILRFNPDSNLLTCQTQVENRGGTPLSIDWCASASLPLDPRASRLFGFTGRWAGEFRLEEVPPFLGSYVRENKNGRTSHDNFPGLIVGTPQTHEQAGPCFGFHLGWSGNNRVRVDRLSDGRAFVQMGEYFFPGEMQLEPGATYRTPRLYAGYTSRGFSALSRKFHHHLCNEVMDGRISGKTRPIHYNTWEAVYFDHDKKTLFDLADKAAWVGAERFVLDDGWFGSRRNDKAGLGDWWPSPDAYPEGLGPLVDHVRSLGMEFGLWFEPEMVNPDSDLFRNHPDWILHAEGIEQVPFRSQYVLDLTRAEVGDYLFECMHKLLSAHDIGYIKWDMNRDVHHPGSRGRPVIHKQTRALYALIERVRAAFPSLEIESCASGGGRADYGVLRRTDRIWTSDSNDALDRQRIQRGASHFFPLSIMGAHVGPETCHITGRRLTMELRVATALFGHMGMELNLLEEDPENLEILKSGISLHKTYRDLLHSGDYFRFDTPPHANAIGVVAEDQSEALFSWCNLTGHRETVPGRFHVPGLDSDKRYRTKVVWPMAVKSVSAPSVVDALDLSGAGRVLPGDALQHVGLQVPLLHPETCLIYHFKAE